jgi:undecaprenyl-diphosphatase
MNLIQAILMGIVQGLSEFLPISSSAHLVFTSNFYKVFANVPIHNQNSQEIFFDIMVHLGTLIAVIVFFRKDIWKIIKALFTAIKTKDWKNADAKMGLFIILGTVITVFIAYPINKVAEFLVYKPEIVGVLLVVTAFVLFFSEWLSKHKESKKNEVDLKTSIMIGIAQGLAALPGFSRSGWTIATGLFFGLDRITAARYSFLLSIPIILGASMVYPLVEIDMAEIAGYNWKAIIIGTVVSCVVGYLCIKYFMKFLSKFSLNIFAYYCLIVGILTFVFFTIY